MIEANKLISFFKRQNINFYTGVPDSVLKEFCLIVDKFPEKNHVRAVNEGSAVAIAAGYSMSKKKIPCVYLQNSGLGNSINPLTSVTHKKIYSIPMLLLIGWRGSPKSKDEPQHIIKGKITPKLLKILNIKFSILKSEKDFVKLKKLLKYSKLKNEPVACLVSKGVLLNRSKNYVKFKKNVLVNRSKAIKILKEKIKKKTYLISTTGYTSRELFEINNISFNKKIKTFYNVGGMGHASSIALGVSLNKKNEVICLDGDGSILMHLGSVNTIGKYAKENFKHILFNNFCHQSVGSQKTNSDKINFEKLSKSLNYRQFYRAKSLNEYKKKISLFLNSNGPSFFEVLCSNEKMTDLGRPSNFNLLKKLFI